jgi:hypothetical protein
MLDYTVQPSTENQNRSEDGRQGQSRRPDDPEQRLPRKQITTRGKYACD